MESTFLPGCPSCGVIASHVKERCCHRLRDIPVAGRVEMLWLKRRWFCDELPVRAEIVLLRDAAGPAPGPNDAAAVANWLRPTLICEKPKTVSGSSRFMGKGIPG